MNSVLAVILGTIATVTVGGLTYLGARFTATRAREGAAQTSKVDAQESALSAWQELLEPYRAETATLRAEVKAQRAELEEERVDRRRAEAEERSVTQEQVARLTDRIDLLTLQLTEWKRLARVIARWATTLRDELIRQGGTVPATPEELLTLTAIEDAENEGHEGRDQL